MKKINLKPFNVSVLTPDGTKKEVPYNITDSLIELLFNPVLKLNSVKLLKQNELAKDTEANDELLVEEEEYDRLKEALEKVEGLGKNDVELVNRVINAENITI